MGIIGFVNALANVFILLILGMVGIFIFAWFLFCREDEETIRKIKEDDW
ncbi:hypothetical protein [Methanocaldococcus jannaschii]|nr:hypothetical protein [Methanocaldococcus jannaschii]